MKLFAALIALKDILLTVLKIIKYVGAENAKRKLIEAKDKAIEEKDQRYIEESLGAESGKPSDREYTGMYTRERKDRR